MLNFNRISGGGGTHSLVPAFTLAEVLITLGIIGVVAAITMPTLIQNYQDHVIISRVKQVYSLFSQAFVVAQSKYGTADMWFVEGNSADAFWFDRISENLKVVDTCVNVSNYYMCKPVVGRFYRPAYSPDRSPKSIIAIAHKCGVLNNGTYFCFSEFRTDSGKWWGRYGKVTVDINGPNSPNQFGKDLFYFEIADYTTSWGRLRPPNLYAFGFGEKIEGHSLRPGSRSCLEGFGSACAAWILEYGNVDYLHCRQQLIDKGTTSCKD